MDEVEALRRFNRCYTQRIGVLAESYLDTGRPLGPSRVLFEVGFAGAAVADLRRRLALDSGYLSRLLRQLQGEALVEVEVDPADGRQRRVNLTAAGRAEWARLDERSHAVARDLLAPLSPQRRTDFATTLVTAERMLRAATVRIEAVDPSSWPARHALARYFAELDERFRTGFDPAVGGADDAREMATPPGTFLVMFDDQCPVGCGGLQPVGDRTAEVKRMWIDPGCRGLGLGAHLLAILESTARDLGHERVILDTNETLREAVSMYVAAGYDAIDRYNDNPYAHHWFAKRL